MMISYDVLHTRLRLLPEHNRQHLTFRLPLQKDPAGDHIFVIILPAYGMMYFSSFDLSATLSLANRWRNFLVSDASAAPCKG